MAAVDAVRIVFAVAVVVAAASVVLALADRISRRLLLGAVGGLAAAALAGWVAFALDPTAGLAVAAAGITLAAATTAAALKLGEFVARVRGIDDELTRAQQRLRTLVERETADRAAELERTLARARAESASLLADQERRVADERRRIAEERTREASASLAGALAAAQRQVEQRLQEWRDDLERSQRAIADELGRVRERQRQLIAEAEARIAADAERIAAESEQQREGLVRLRDEVARVTRDAVEAGNQELETFGTERRRALHELNERLRRRERSLAELIEREEGEAMRRIQSAFTDVERRQVEQLSRIVERAAARYAEAASQQFADAIRAARESAATRLSRELDRAVEAFAREAQSVLAERLAQVGDAGSQRLEKRLNQIAAGLERQRAETVSSFEERLVAAEQELRRRLETLAADAEAERAVLEARLHELARRIDDAVARA